MNGDARKPPTSEFPACALTCPGKSHTQSPRAGKMPECRPPGSAWPPGGRRAPRTVPAGGVLLPAPAGGARARAGGSPQSRGPREQAPPQAHFIFNTPGTQRCSPSLPMKEVRLRVKQLPKGTQNPGAQAPGPLRHSWHVHVRASAGQPGGLVREG